MTTNILNLRLNVQQFVYLVDINYRVCQKIHDETDHGQPTNHGFWKLSANNAFYSALNTLHTLVDSTKKEEIRIKPILERIIVQENDKDVMPEFESKGVALFEKFMSDYPAINPNFNDPEYDFLREDDGRLVGDILSDVRKAWRLNRWLDKLKEIQIEYRANDLHKIRHQTTAHTNKTLKEPAGSSFLLINEEILERLHIITKKLRVCSYFWFEYEMSNPLINILQELDEQFS